LEPEKRELFVLDRLKKVNLMSGANPEMVRINRRRELGWEANGKFKTATF
jgi:hypothetical protein